MLKTILPLCLIVLCLACSEPVKESYNQTVSASGEFLFEGPNTLQGPLNLSSEDIAVSLDISAEAIKGVVLSDCSIRLSDEANREIVESFLVQIVSDKLELVSLATLNPVPESGEIVLSVNQEVDILPYLQDNTATLVVDSNLKSDAEVLDVDVNLGLIVNVKN